MHIKAHQDDTYKEFGGVGPMHWHAHYNIIADKIAETKHKTLGLSDTMMPPPSIKAA